MMGLKAVEPKLYLSFSLDNAVPANHLVRRIAAGVDLDFVRGFVQRRYSHTGQDATRQPDGALMAEAHSPWRTLIEQSNWQRPLADR
jgi:hypothetical protein